MKRATTSSSKIAAVLIEDVRCGIIAVGETLPTERALCERFATSRPTVRGAIQELQNRGYASREAAHRPRAALPTFGSILQSASTELQWVLSDTETGAHLEQVRQFMEIGAVRVAARRASDADVAQIHDALILCHEAIGDTAAFGRADVGFHRSIVVVTRNPIILDMHDRFVLDIVAARSPPQDVRRENRVSYDEHRRIFEAIAGNDPESAVTAMERHLGRAYRQSLALPVNVKL